MSSGIYQATAGAVARQSQVDIIANNLANRDTAGFRTHEVSFERVLGDARAPNRQMVVTTETRLDTEPGPMRRTDRPMDFALRQPGYVRAQTLKGQAVLLRTSQLRRNANGFLADTKGHLVVAQGRAPIRLEPEVPVTLSQDGMIRQHGEPVGQLWFQQVPDESRLEALGGGAYRVTEGSGEPFDSTNQVMAGFVEGSNIKALEGMVRLIALERGYQASMKVIQAYREADEQLIERTGQ